MKPSRSLGRLAFAALSLSSAVSAWSWPDVDAFIVRRADKTTTSPSPPTQTAGSAANTFNLNTGTVDVDSATATATTTGTDGKDGTTTVTGKTGGKKTTSAKNGTHAHTTYNVQDPAGGVVMITPAATAASQLYKIGDFVTWAWNYTNLQGTPTAVDVLAACSAASRTFTLTQNMTFHTEARYTWDTDAYQSSHINAQLLTQQYTLVIYDAESSISATAEPGYLGTFDSFVFGLYTPQAYTALSDGWTCATCSGAISDVERRALGFALAMSVITVLSFTWFVTGLGGVAL